MTPTLPTRFRLRLKGRLAQERGQAMVEFAIVLPVLLMVIVGILSFGRYENYSSQQTQMASEAVRYAALDVNPASAGGHLQDYVQAQATGELRTGGTSAVTSKAAVYVYYPNSGTGAIGTPVTACVVSTVSLLPMLGALVPLTVQIVQWSTMRIESITPTNGGWSTANNVASVPSKCP